MKKLFTSLFFISYLIINLPLLALEGEKDFSILLPINHLSEQKVSLSVQVDKSYKALQPLPSKLMEFIPEGDDENKWSKILTVQTLVNIKASASAFLDKIKTAMKSKAESFKILEESSKDMKNYQVSSFGAVYEYGGRREVVYMRYYTGPADLAGLQFAEAIDPKQNPEETLNKLVSYVDSISQVME